MTGFRVGRWWCHRCQCWETPEHVFTDHDEHEGPVDCPSCGEERGVERVATPDGWLHRPCASCGMVLSVV